MARLLKALVFLCFFAFVMADHLEFVADLTTDQEVPPAIVPPPGAGGNGTNATTPLTGPFTGVGIFWFDTSSNVLNWTIEHTIQDVTAAHIHGPALRGVVADPIIPIQTLSPIKGNATLTTEQWNWLQNGSLYVNVHTAEFPGGFIRGQIENSPLTFEAVLSGAAVIPALTTVSNYTGTAVFKYKSETKTLSWDIVHDVRTASAGGIHGPAEDDETAGVVVSFTTTATTTIFPEVKGSVTLTADQETALLDEKMYVQFNSTGNPNGEIRGQIVITGEKKGSGLSAGVIVLIVFIVIAVVLGVGAFAFLQLKKRRKQRFEVVGSHSGDYVPPNF